VPSYSIEDREGAIHVFFRLERPAAKKPVEKQVKAEPVQKAEPAKPKPKPPTKPEPRQERQPTTAARGNALSIGLGGGLYFTQNSDFQEIYDKNSSFLGLAVTFYKSISAVENLGFTLEGDYITDSGMTTYTEEEVKLTMTPVILDIFYQRYFGRFAPFAGLGASYFSYKEELPETFPVSEVTGSILGYNFLVGTHIKLIEQLSIKAYLRYHVAKKTEEDGNEVDLSGSELGIGLSYFFNF
jgi:outer membrane protein W